MSNKNYFLIGFTTLMLFIGICSLILWKNSVFSRVKSYELIGEFQSINGLLINAVVKYRGFPIGRVTKIVPEPDKISVFFFIDNQYDIPRGSTVKIIFDGLVGEKYMEIIPNPNSPDIYEEGSRLVGFSSAGLSDFIDVGTQNLLELKAILNTMSSVFGNEKISDALQSVIFSMQDATTNMEKIIEKLYEISGSDKLVNIIDEVDALVTNINKAVREEDLVKIQNTIQNLEDFSINLKEILQDDELKDSLISTFKETSSTFQQSSSFLTTISQIKLLTEAEFKYKVSPVNYMVYYLNLNFWLDKSYLNFGFSNYFEEEDKLVNVLLNIPFSERIRFSYGLIKTSPGFGIDYELTEDLLWTTLRVYNFEDPYLDFYVKYHVFKNIYLNSGYNEFNKETRSVFVGFSFSQE